MAGRSCGDLGGASDGELTNKVAGTCPGIEFLNRLSLSKVSSVLSTSAENACLNAVSDTAVRELYSNHRR